MNSVARLRQLAVLFLATTVAFVGIYWWRLSASHEQLRNDSLSQAALRAGQISDAVTQQMDALMHAIDFGVRQLRDQYAAGTPATFEATMRTALDAFPDGSLLQIGVIDADGYLAWSNLGVKGRVYLGDREHYKAHVGASEDRLFISKPVFGRASKSWSVQHSPDAPPHAAVISVTDVTQLVATEDSLRLAQSVFESAGEGIMVTDSANLIVAVNPAFSHITGYSAEEVIGRTPALLASGQHDPVFYRTMWQRLQANGRWEGEINNRRRDGRLTSNG